MVAAVAVVAVVVGALGIFNTMTAAVLERTNEMGVLRAVGMGRATAFALMATEAVLLSLAGGVAGFALAAVGGRAVAALVRPFVPLASEAGLPSLTLSAAGTCLLLTLLVGLGAGLYPAWQASRLRPAQALRAAADA